MKLRSTTPASLSFRKKSLLVALVVVMALAVPIQIAGQAYANRFSDQINALNEEIAKYQAEATRLSGQAQTLQTEVARLSNEKATIQAQVDLSQATFDKLVVDIANTEKKIKDNQDALGATIADLYVDGSISPLEMLASSQNIGDFLDKEAYRSSIRDQLTATISDIKDLKVQLDTQKVEAERVLVDKKGQRDILAKKEAEQQQLLAQTRGQESAYQQLSAQRSAELEAVQAQQRAAIAALTNNGSNTAGSAGTFQYRNYSGNLGPCGGGYPAVWCNAPVNAYVDSWALYSRQCVSYTAWAAQVRFNKRVTSFSGSGHAYQWPSTASALMGANVDNTPRVGSVAVTPRTSFTPLGHTMMVEEVYGDGWIRISQYNFAGTGEYSTMDLKVSSAVYVHFRDR